MGFSLESSEGVEVANLWAKREALVGRGSCACLLLVRPAALQPHSSRHLPGPENNLDSPQMAGSTLPRPRSEACMAICLFI